MTEPLTQCPYCGASLRPSLRFCEQCGAELRSAQSIPEPSDDFSAKAQESPFPSPAPPSPPGPMFPETPRQEPPSAQVSSPQPPPSWTPPPEPARNKSRSGLWITCLILLIVLCLLSICAVAGYWLFSQPDFLSSLGIF
ncbi:MAG: zinc-ribbon domain-containing protein [Anaerolineales bacterium]|nr:zinc-ribbon domain-containing protein [Anaerolineales bacterium]